MVSCLNKLLWQSKRRKSVDISCRRIPEKNNNNNNNSKDAIADEKKKKKNGNSNNNNKSQLNNQNQSQTVATNRDLDVSIKSIKSTSSTTPTTIINEDQTNQSTTTTMTNNKENLKQTTNDDVAQMNKHQQHQHQHQLRPIDLNAATPGILYVALVAVLVSLVASCQLATCEQAADIRRLDPNTGNSGNSQSSLLAPANKLGASPFVSTIDWQRIGSRLAQQFAGGGGGGGGGHQWGSGGGPVGNSWSGINGNRWSYGPNDHNTRDSYRYPERRENYLVRTFNRIRNRIGARNTIRVHNAFRDMAWQLLSRLSMPTPVIYELRRQHMYSPDEDLMNDSLFNKNTTRTIRTKRLLNDLLDSWHHNAAGATHKHNNNNNLKRASNDDDDDDEPEGLRERLRMRLEDLLNLSRRSLFGRVVRVPSIFPFKRHQEDDDDDNNKSKSANRANKQPSGKSNQRFSVRRKRMKKKESDKQMIQINGKQYYVDDDGELKELKDPANVV